MRRKKPSFMRCMRGVTIIRTDMRCSTYSVRCYSRAYMWQALETKARFIGQIMTGSSTVRQAEDIGGAALSYAEVKAIASGNPAVLTLAETDAALKRLAVMK